jgi:hypothetical protein
MIILFSTVNTDRSEREAVMYPDIRPTLALGAALARRLSRHWAVA